MRTLAVVALVTAAAPTARAGEGDRTLVIAVDGFADTVIAGGVAIEAPAPVVFGMLVYLVGPPIVHLAHGKPGTAAASLGLRAGIPFFTSFIAAQTFGRPHGGVGHSGYDRPVAGLVGMLVGVAVTQVIDWTLLSDGDDDPAPAPRLLSFGGNF